MAEFSLDDPSTYKQLDPDDMYAKVNDLEAQIQDSRSLAGSLVLPSDFSSARAVLIAGMGGSAIGGTLLETYGTDQIPVPVVVWRGYGVPAWVDRDTLLIAISYSGNTEETLSAFAAARERGARMLAVSTGGQLELMAREADAPVLKFNYQAQPRAALGYLFTPLVCIFDRLGFLPAQEEALDEAIRVVQRARQQWGGERPEESNLAKSMARDGHGRIVVIYGGGYLSGVARRWKTQMNENAKNWAFYEEFSELNHNAVMGYARPPDGANVQVYLLNGSLLPERIRLRMVVTSKLLDQFGVRNRNAGSLGDGKLSQIFSLIMLGDYVSYYLALLNKVDPTEIAPIDYLKAELAKA